ncbi:hypothetical protein GCM10022214_26220 [Actinomadura miaoliensis]|uniref:Phenylacetate--CoA ligase family protein n=1 Tax=Actinomadura miaoliensis TaxID=430685 RepID=A0ABP7VL80_9ACTN
MHLNADWAILEPVDEQYRPVPPGRPSHAVLLTNLANRLQPILRYDLGDAVQARPGPCPCGNPGPAIRVQGRAADLLTFPRPDGQPVTLAPLPLATLLEAVPGLELFQIVQTTPTMLRIRLHPAPPRRARHPLASDPDPPERTAGPPRPRPHPHRTRQRTAPAERRRQVPRRHPRHRSRTPVCGLAVQQRDRRAASGHVIRIARRGDTCCRPFARVRATSPKVTLCSCSW